MLIIRALSLFSSIHQIHHSFSVWEQISLKPFTTKLFGKKTFFADEKKKYQPTKTLKNNTLFYQAGAGLVAHSVPENELQEVNNKLGALKKAIKKAEKI